MNARTILLLALGPAGLTLAASSRSILADIPYTVVVDSLCPPEGDGDRRKIVTLLAEDGQDPFRVQMGITNTDTSEIRVLVDSTDADVCKYFIDTVKLPPSPEWSWAFYEANGFYFVVSRAATPGLALRMHPMIVFDSTLTVKKALGM